MECILLEQRKLAEEMGIIEEQPVDEIDIVEQEMVTWEKLMNV